MSSILDGTTVEIETTLLPTFTVDLGDAASGPPSPLVQFLRPKVRVTRGTALLAQLAPAGEPSKAPPYGLILLALLGVALILWGLS